MFNAAVNELPRGWVADFDWQDVGARFLEPIPDGKYKGFTIGARKQASCNGALCDLCVLCGENSFLFACGFTAMGNRNGANIHRNGGWGNMDLVLTH